MDAHQNHLQTLNLPPRILARFADASDDELAALMAWKLAHQRLPFVIALIVDRLTLGGWQ